MKKITLLLLLFSQSILLLQAQSKKDEKPVIRCGSDQYNHQLIRSHPEMMGGDRFEQSLQKIIAFKKAQRLSETKATNAVITIPVVVHVFHNGEDVGVAPNITDAQIASQIAVLNQDFRRAAGTPGFNTSAVGADVEIEFCLAQQTPDGCPTNGIDRIDLGQDGIIETSESDAFTKVNALKPSTIWDSSNYLNIWTIKLKGGSGLLGYAQFPGGSSATDGVVIDYKYFGSIDYNDGSFLLNAPYNKGRTTTHEVGHYLGLYHTFEGGCAGENSTSGDFCADTPAVAEANELCPENVDSCPTGGADMVENYMDYTQDSCMNIFTIDQKSRMQATMSSSRLSLLSSNACSAPVAVNYDGSIQLEGVNLSNCSVIAPKVRLTNYGTSTLTSATINYNIDGGTSQSQPWSGALQYGEYVIVTLPSQNVALGNHDFNVSVTNPNGNVDSRDCNDLASINFDTAINVSGTSKLYLTITPDNYGSEITWEFGDGTNMVASGGPYTDGDTTTITATFDISDNSCYYFKIIDAAGDGICCGEFGDGSYELKDDSDNIIASGAQYGSSQTTNISTLTLGIDEYFAKNNIKIYPNPASDMLNISLAISNDLPDGYKIYNTLGQLISNSVVNSISDLAINTSQFKSGLYFIRIEKEGHFVSYPFVKK
ncbi:M43 family zinc metalloprotease [Aestuariibaculum suncheonense]|uniref:T9SS type A sorting domain-containing protein n=1 Tax=Aestuariibaculum suncheonense TaxID=1028745 RepID=A0A8J6QHH6_9FLAO|nr:M43 family zinc metalloprotease [Aestuariibaculum suncheonense]MBD0836540.1 T9SS type A sorting domain-containing protein [Aestuariibaculum suncheonense]